MEHNTTKIMKNTDLFLQAISEFTCNEDTGIVKTIIENDHTERYDEIIVWEPFENYPIQEVIDLIYDKYNSLLATQPKETRVYLMDVDDTHVTSYDIDNWLLYSERHDKLTQDAEHFITECEEIGKVYSLYEFQNACNLDEINLTNSYIFITNKY